MADYENCSDQAERKVVTEHLCQPCEKKQMTMVANIYCDTCGEFQCRECSKGHEMFSFMAGHKLKEVNQSTLPTSAVQSIDMKGLDMCVKHNKQFLFYSVDLDILLCSSCIVLNHKKYEHIQELDSEDIKSSVVPNQDLETMVSKLDDSVKSMLQDLHEAKQSIGQSLEGIHNVIDENRDLIVQQFEELKINITTSIGQKEQESEKKFDEMITRSTATVDKVTVFRDILPDVLDHGTSTQTFILQHVVSKHAADFHIFKNTNTVQPCAFSLKISPHLTGLLAHDHQLATLNLEANEETNVLSPIDDTDSILPSAETDDNTDPPTRVTLQLLHSIVLQKGPNDSNFPLYTGLNFLPDRRLVAVDFNNDKMLIYSENLVQLGTYQLRGQRNGVAVISENEVAVSDGISKTLELFNIRKKNRVKFLRSLSTSAPCDSISLMNDATTVVVSNYNAQPAMRMISLTNGNEEYFFNLKFEQYEIGTSKCTYVSSADMLAFSDKEAHTVYLHTKNGNHLTCQAVKHASIQHPAGICEGPGDSVIVCSWATHSLAQISTSGTVLASHELGMPYPFSVCIARDGQRLAVSSHNIRGINQLQVYQIHG